MVRLPEGPSAARPRHVLHLAHGFDVGGLETVVAELVARLPPQHYRHTVVALTRAGLLGQALIERGVEVIALDKAPGHAVPLYPRLLRLLRQLRPDVLHTCNLAALEVVPLAWLARVPMRVHAEHGWDVQDPEGLNRRYQWMRRLYRPFVHRYVTVSRPLQSYLIERVGVSPDRIHFIPNGVDTRRFAPLGVAAAPPPDWPFDPARHWVVGTVGRMATVKNQALLARAFVALVRSRPRQADRLRLAMVGQGPLMREVQQVLESAGLARHAWLPGARLDVDRVLPHFQAYVLPSVTEGTSCTLQEAMACGVPVVATSVGGTPDLLEHGRCGLLVPSADEQAMARALGQLLDQPEEAARLGQAGRDRVVQDFSLESMLLQYRRAFSI